MDQDLAGLFELPRRLMREEIAARHCIHETDFCLINPQCWNCDIGAECLTLKTPDGELENSPERRLVASFEISMNYIEGKIRATGHNKKMCTCELCSWSREAARCYHGTVISQVMEG